MGRTRWLVLLAGVSAAALTQSFSAAADTNPQPIDNTHNVVNAPAPIPGATFGAPRIFKSGTAICSITTATGNANTDCAEPGVVGPHNETSIAVNPTNASNIIGGVNDYEITVNSAGHAGETVLSRAHVTSDRGHTWTEYPIIFDSAYSATGDPSLAFDASGHAYYGTLGFRFVGAANAQTPDVLVANSGDGGVHWDSVRVDTGSGVEAGTGDLLDKEYVAAWGSGNAIVTFGEFELRKGNIVESFILSSVTHDFGAHWSTPVVISGTDNQAFVAYPTVAHDGTTTRIFVEYFNTRNLNNGRDDVRVVEVSPATGAALGSPVTAVPEIKDGFTDYPVALGRQTYQDSRFRTWAAGSITADPTKAGHVAVIWSDMSGAGSVIAPNLDPYSSTTNSDVRVSESFDHGASWSAPAELAISNDQFMPWGAYDQSGKLRIGFFDRSYDTANHKYGYTLATVTSLSPLAFTTSQVTSTLSDPTKNDRWFSAAPGGNPAFPHATAFLGDYSTIAITPTGVVAYWTDMRNSVTFGRTGAGEDAYFATAG